MSFDATSAEMSEQINSKKNKPTLKTRRKKKVIRPGVFIEAGVHGREWISPAVATWILKELVKYNNTEGQWLTFFYNNWSLIQKHFFI